MFIRAAISLFEIFSSRQAQRLISQGVMSGYNSSNFLIDLMYFPDKDTLLPALMNFMNLFQNSFEYRLEAKKVNKNYSVVRTMPDVPFVGSPNAQNHIIQ